LFVPFGDSGANLFIGTFKMVHLWSFEEKAIVCSWRGHKGRIEKMLHTKDTLISCSSDGIGFWDIKKMLSQSSEEVNYFFIFIFFIFF
jgi:hypothetical protein